MNQIIPGQKFNRLTVIKRSYGKKNTSAIFLCDCGVEKELEYYAAVQGYTKSCGCLRQDIIDKKVRVRHKGEPVKWLQI